MRRAQDRVEVIDDLHRPRVQRGRAGSAGDDCDLSAITSCGERRAVTGNAAADDQDSGHLETMRLVSATSCLSWRTRSSGVANLISGWR